MSAADEGSFSDMDASGSLQHGQRRRPCRRTSGVTGVLAALLAIAVATAASATRPDSIKLTGPKSTRVNQSFGVKISAYGARNNNLLRYYSDVKRCAATDWAEQTYAKHSPYKGEQTFAGPGLRRTVYPITVTRRGIHHFCAYLVDPSALSAHPETKQSDTTYAHASFTWTGK